jgi:hypothetical protein
LTSELVGDEWSASCPGCFTTGETETKVKYYRFITGEEDEMSKVCSMQRERYARDFTGK